MFDNQRTLPSDIVDKLVKDTMPLGYILWDIEGNGIDCSPSVLQLFGLSMPLEVFDKWWQLSPPVQPNGRDSKEFFSELVSSANTSGKVVLEWWHTTIDGEPLPVEVTLVQHSHEGNVFLIAYLRDLRDHQETRHDQQDVDTGHVRMATILRSCPICCAIVLDDRLAFATPFMRQFLGVKPGDTFSSLFTDPAMGAKICRGSPGDSEVSWIPVTIQSPSGEFKEMLAYSICLGYTENSEKIIWLVDVTQSRQLENELKAAKAQAETTTKAKSEFLANMSHEIRTPMNAIIGLSDVLLHSELQPKDRSHVKLLRSSSDTLMFLINDVLDFSKIEAGKQELAHELFDLHQMVESALGMLVSHAAPKGLELCYTCDEPTPRKLIGDGNRLRQVIINLLSNATKFTQSGGVRVHIKTIEREDRKVVLHFDVVDTGTGIPEDKMVCLFKNFSQTEASSRSFGGSGLGLVISQNLVQMMGGIIEVESVLNRGTRFYFDVHLEYESRIPKEVDWSSKAGRQSLPFMDLYELTGHFSLEKKNVLVIDAVEMHRHALVEQLTNWKMSVREADSVSLAMQIAHEAQKTNNPFDLLIVNWALKGNNGSELHTLLSVNKELPEAPMLLMVPLNIEQSHLDDESIPQTQKLLHKPISCSTLYDAILELLFPEDIESAMKSAIPVRRHFDAHAAGHKVRVLVAEDNKANQIVASAILGGANLDCVIAPNGQHAYTSFLEGGFDLILMDCQMPEIDGYEATIMIRKWEKENGSPRIPIIALTANAFTGNIQKCLDVGMDAYCSKPINPTQLLEMIDRFLETKQIQPNK